MIDYKLKIFNISGVLQYEVTDFLKLSYIKGVNIPGILTFRLSGDHAVVTAIGDKWPVEIWRRDKSNGTTWTLELATLFREPDQLGDSPGIFEAFCTGVMTMLSWRVIAWSAGIADRSKFTTEKGETIAKTLVDYNVASNATTGNGRIIGGAITGLTVESDSAGGNTLDWYCHGQNLLETLQELALISGGDFDLVKTATTAYQFRWYSGQLGTDRSATVLFSLGKGNMGDPFYRISRLQEKTLVIVAGQGEGTERDYITRQGTNYNASTNHIETFVDAREIIKGDTTALEDKGDVLLTSFEEDEIFDFSIIQTPATLYSSDYFLGDLVSAVSPFTGNTVTRKVSTITVSFDQNGQETIGIGLANVT